MRRTICLLLFGMLIAIQPVRPAHAASAELKDRLHDLAVEILKVTKNQPINVGVFSPTGLADTNSGPGIEQTLSTELNRLASGIVRPKAKYEIKGGYAFAKSHDPNLADLKVIKITATVIDSEFAEEIVRIPLEVTLDGTKTIADILQISGTLPKEGSKLERNERIEKLRAQPGCAIGGDRQTLIKSSADSPYAVEILAGPLDASLGQLEARSAKLDEKGEADVELGKGELYEVKIYNTSPRDVAVSLSIDGIDEFQFSKDRIPDGPNKGRPKFTHFIVSPPGTKENDALGNPLVGDGTLTIVGWHNSIEGKQNFLSFLVTEYGKGAASKSGLAARGNLGVIHVQFSDCHPLAEGQGLRSGTETGFGPPREVKTSAVKYEVEPPHEFVSIRYSR